MLDGDETKLVRPWLYMHSAVKSGCKEARDEALGQWADEPQAAIIHAHATAIAVNHQIGAGTTHGKIVGGATRRRSVVWVIRQPRVPSELSGLIAVTCEPSASEPRWRNSPSS